MGTGDKRARVAVIGARGIGRHHANWWHLSGVEVCAIVGAAPGLLEPTVAALQAMFGFSGRAYLDVGEMLRAEGPAFVDVCSPPAFHEAHVRAGLEAGAHVLCEKPFLFQPGVEAGRLLAVADELLALAQARGLCLALCSQYWVVGELCGRILAEERPGAGLQSIEVRLASPLKGRMPDPLETWVDLGPHPLAAFQALLPGGTVDWAGLRVKVEADSVVGEFSVQPAVGGGAVACRAHVHRTRGEPSHIRRVTLNGIGFDLDGEKGTDGVYRARLVSPLGIHRADDPMHTMIRRMAGGTLEFRGPAIRENLERLLRIAGRVREAPLPCVPPIRNGDPV